MLTFLASQAVLTALAHTVLPQIRDPMYFDKQVRLSARVAARSAGAQPETVVMLGSSRTAYALRGTDLERLVSSETGRSCVAFNLGVPAAGPITNQIGLRRVLAAGVRPDLVLVELLPAGLASVGTGPLEHLFLKAERLSAEETALAVGYGFPARATWARAWESHLVPAYGHRFPIRGRFLPHWSPWSLRFDFGRGGDETGWSRQVNERLTSGERRAALARARAEYFDVLPHIDVHGPASRAVRDTLALCRRHDVRAALVLMPEGADFRGWYPPAVSAKLAEFLAGICRETGATVIDAREWVRDEDFSDSHHLLSPGARVFTERLGREYVLPLLTARAEAQSDGRP